jgi:glycerol kinase
VVCVAGGARGDLLRQIRADVTGLPVSRPDDVETTARGAAMLAAAGAGLHPDVPAASRAMAGKRSEPCTRGRSASRSTTTSTAATAAVRRPAPAVLSRR